MITTALLPDVRTQALVDVALARSADPCAARYEVFADIFGSIQIHSAFECLSGPQ